MYRLVIYTKFGRVSKHYYPDYETLDYNAAFVQFSHNVIKAFGQELRFFRWRTLFTIESQNEV